MSVEKRGLLIETILSERRIQNKGLSSLQKVLIVSYPDGLHRLLRLPEGSNVGKIKVNAGPI